MNINNLTRILGSIISLGNLKTQQHILQRSADEIRVGVEMMESFKGWNYHYSMINHNARNNKKAKESFVKEQAEKWKGKIDDRAYQALMNYTVEIDD